MTVDGNFIWLFLFVFSILLFLLVKDKLFFKKKKLIRLYKYDTIHKRSPFSDSSDSGIIYVSKLVKPMGMKSEKNFAIPKKDINSLVSQIKYNGFFDVKVIVNPNIKEPSITIKGDKSFVELIEVNIDGDVITIKHQQITCHYDLDCQIIINTKDLTSFQNKGRGQIDIEGIQTETFSYLANSIENSYLSGQVKTLKIISKSKGDVFAQQLVAKEKLHAEIYGIGDVYLNSSKAANIYIHNSGNAYLKEIPITLEKGIDGDGRIIYRPFEDKILNFIFIGIQKIFRMFKRH